MKNLKLEQLIPHRSPALIVRSIESHSLEGLIASGRIDPDHPLAVRGRVPAILAMEFAAQSAGLLLGLLRVTEDSDAAPPEVGYLASLRDVRLDMQTFPVDCPLTAEVTIERQFASMASFIATVRVGEDVAATGRLTVSG